MGEEQENTGTEGLTYDEGTWSHEEIENIEDLPGVAKTMKAFQNYEEDDSTNDADNPGHGVIIKDVCDARYGHVLTLIDIHAKTLREYKDKVEAMLSRQNIALGGLVTTIILVAVDIIIHFR